MRLHTSMRIRVLSKGRGQILFLARLSSKKRTNVQETRSDPPARDGLSTSRIESIDLPRLALTGVAQTIVQSVRTAEPKLDALRDQPEAAPERWSRYRRSLKPAFDLSILFLERFARREHGTLVRRPGAKLTAAG